MPSVLGRVPVFPERPNISPAFILYPGIILFSIKDKCAYIVIDI